MVRGVHREPRVQNRGARRLLGWGICFTRLIRPLAARNAPDSTADWRGACSCARFGPGIALPDRPTRRPGAHGGSGPFSKGAQSGPSPPGRGLAGCRGSTLPVPTRVALYRVGVCHPLRVVGVRHRHAGARSCVLLQRPVQALKPLRRRSATRGGSHPGRVAVRREGTADAVCTTVLPIQLRRGGRASGKVGVVRGDVGLTSNSYL